MTGSIEEGVDIKSYFQINRPKNLFFTTGSRQLVNSLFPVVETQQVMYTRGNVSKFATASFGFCEDGLGMPTYDPALNGAIAESVVPGDRFRIIGPTQFQFTAPKLF